MRCITYMIQQCTGYKNMETNMEILNIAWVFTQCPAIPILWVAGFSSRVIVGFLVLPIWFVGVYPIKSPPSITSYIIIGTILLLSPIGQYYWYHIMWDYRIYIISCLIIHIMVITGISYFIHQL